MNLKPSTKIVICGPTASGKSKLALDLALQIDAVIINFDSQQLYKELPLMSAQPSSADQALVPHYLYGIVSGKIPFSVAKWLDMANQLIDSIAPDQNIIFVGGTGLYLNGLLNGLSPIPEISTEVRNYVRNISFEEVVSQLGEKADGNNYRMRRRLEVKLATGKDIEAFYNQPNNHRFTPSNFVIFNVAVSRGTTYAGINNRYDNMLKNGGLEEIKTLYQDGSYDLNLPLMKACGVREIISYLKGEIELNEACEKAKQSTRNYAKRQMTWFRHKLPDHKIDIDNNSVDFILKRLKIS